MPHNLAVLVEAAHVHGAGREVDAAGNMVRCGVEVPKVSSALMRGCSPCQPPTAVCWGEALIRIMALETTPYSRPYRRAFGGIPTDSACYVVDI
jgi:hypothetical protein